LKNNNIEGNHGSKTRHAAMLQRRLPLRRLHRRQQGLPAGIPSAATAVVSLPAPVTPQPIEPGPVESGVKAEISGFAAQVRPGLAATALALARIMDNPRAVSQQPALAAILGTLSKPTQRHGKLAVVKSMTNQRAAR
jgi:hypothetical protein